MTVVGRGSAPDLEGDFPPVLLCARCGLPSCACEADGRVAHPRSSIAFESGISLRSLWSTAVSCSVDPARFFGQRLRGSGVGRVLAFAVLAEMLALGSVFISLAALVVALLPSLLPVLLSPTALVAGLAVWVGATIFMVVAHALGGLTFLVSVERKPPGSLPLVFRFGMYSCGWDLLTSPAGIVLALAGKHGPRLSPVWKAAFAPRPAMHALLTDALGLSPEEEKRALARAAKTALFWLSVIVSAAVWLGYAWLFGDGGFSWP